MNVAVVGGRDEGPRFVESVALIPSAHREDRLRAVRPPSHSAQLETLSDERLARGLDDAAADHEALALPHGVAHAVLVLTKVREDLRDSFDPRVVALQVRERRDNGLGAVVLVEETLAQELELVSRGERAVAVNGGDGGREMLGRVSEVQDLRTLRQRRRVLPVVAAGVGDLRQPHVRVLRQHVREVFAKCVLERELLRFGAAAEADRGD